jgi:DNA-binding IclR family transcriptional regulator
MKPEGAVSRSVDRTISILDFLATELRAASLSDIADATGLDKSTAHRFLRSFEEHRLVQRNDQTRRYTLGTRIMEWGGRALENVDIRTAADPVLRQLHHDTEETVILYIPEGERRIAVVVYDSPKEILVSRRLGSAGPLVLGAAGKAILAFLAPEMRDALLLSAPELDDEMRSSIAAEIPEIQAQEFACSTREIVDHAWAIASPVLNLQRQPIASVSIASPVTRHSEEIEQRFAALIVPAAREISTTLGIRAPRSVLAVPRTDGEQGGLPPVSLMGGD